MLELLFMLGICMSFKAKFDGIHGNVASFSCLLVNNPKASDAYAQFHCTPPGAASSPTAHHVAKLEHVFPNVMSPRRGGPGAPYWVLRK